MVPNARKVVDLVKELFTMWRHTNLVVLVALSAAIFAALLIPFQAIPIIPGIASLRVADIFPPVFGLLFGPAGAWGIAIGNLIGDFFGTLSPASFAGFIANFFQGFLSYKLWNALSAKNDAQLKLDSYRKVFRYELIQVIRQCSIVVVLVFSASLALEMAPAKILYLSTLIPGLLLAAFVSPIILRAVYPRLRKWGLLWTDIMEPQEVSKKHFSAFGLVLTILGAVGGTIALGFGVYGTAIPADHVAIRLMPIPFIIILFAGSLMLGGREQITVREPQSTARSEPQSE